MSRPRALLEITRPVVVCGSGSGVWCASTCAPSDVYDARLCVIASYGRTSSRRADNAIGRAGCPPPVRYSALVYYLGVEIRLRDVGHQHGFGRWATLLEPDRLLHWPPCWSFVFICRPKFIPALWVVPSVYFFFATMMTPSLYEGRSLHE